MKERKTADGVIFYIDDNDSEFVDKFRWYCSDRKYIYTFIDGKNVRLHRLLLNATPSKIVDHIDSNTLNNTKANLRICTSQQNNFHRKPVKQRSSTSRFKGVRKRGGKWISEIRVNHIKKQIGSFETEADAAIAYNFAAKLVQGEYAYLNRTEE
jgi:hypothetical protein